MMPLLIKLRWGFLTLVLMMTVSQALAQNAGGDNPVNLGVIDMKGVVQNSNAIATIRGALDAQNAIFQAKIAAEEVRLGQEERSLNALKSTLTEAVFQSRLKDFEEEVVSIQRSIQAQKNNFDRSIQQAQTQLEQELLKIVSMIAQERNLSMVFQRQNVVIYNNALDITDEALSRLNDRRFLINGQTTSP